MSEYVIYTRAHGHRDVLLWWRENGNGYTTDLTKAGRFDQQKAESIERGRLGKDVAVEVAVAEAVAHRVVDSAALPHYGVPLWAPVGCGRCGKPVEDDRRCYATAHCHACFPPGVPPEVAFAPARVAP